MPRSRMSRGLRTRLLLCRWVALLASFPALAQDPIVNREVPQRVVSQSSLRAIFSMHMSHWPNGEPIKVFVLSSDDPVHISFAKSVLNIFPYQLKRSWDLMVYSGYGQAPTQVNSLDEMLKKVASTPGAIGYLPEDYLTDASKNGSIRVLAVR